MGSVVAVSDLHVGAAGNRHVVSRLRPEREDDWLLVVGDVAEVSTDVEWALRLLAARWSTVVWTAGNHELWTTPGDPLTCDAPQRYEHYVALCRELGIHTPEDPYPTWEGPGGPVIVAPLFVLYDYSFLPAGVEDATTARRLAEEVGVVCSDEFLLRPGDRGSVAQWCRERLEYTERRLESLEPGVPVALMAHFPLVREPTRVLRYPEFALWCGTTATTDWHRRFGAILSVYGHLHIPRVTHYDGVRFEEVSLGYPREWQLHQHPEGFPRTVLDGGFL